MGSGGSTSTHREGKRQTSTPAPTPLCRDGKACSQSTKTRGQKSDDTGNPEAAGSRRRQALAAGGRDTAHGPSRPSAARPPSGGAVRAPGPPTPAADRATGSLPGSERPPSQECQIHAEGHHWSSPVTSRSTGTGLMPRKAKTGPSNHQKRADLDGPWAPDSNTVGPRMQSPPCQPVPCPHQTWTDATPGHPQETSTTKGGQHTGGRKHTCELRESKGPAVGTDDQGTVRGHSEDKKRLLTVTANSTMESP